GPEAGSCGKAGAERIEHIGGAEPAFEGGWPVSRSIEPDGRALENPRLERPRDDPRAEIRVTLDRASRDRPAMSELIRRLADEGIGVIPSLQKSGRLNGMSYVFKGRVIKGSDLGRAYTAQGLQKRFGVQYDPERDRLPLLEAAEK